MSYNVTISANTSRPDNSASFPVRSNSGQNRFTVIDPTDFKDHARKVAGVGPGMFDGILETGMLLLATAVAALAVGIATLSFTNAAIAGVVTFGSGYLLGRLFGCKVL
jgi:hypothetical protein